MRSLECGMIIAINHVTLWRPTGNFMEQRQTRKATNQGIKQPNSLHSKWSWDIQQKEQMDFLLKLLKSNSPPVIHSVSLAQLLVVIIFYLIIQTLLTDHWFRGLDYMTRLSCLFTTCFPCLGNEKTEMQMVVSPLLQGDAMLDKALRKHIFKSCSQARL